MKKLNSIKWGGQKMKKTTVVLYLFIGFFSLIGITSLSYADSAEVLPKGVMRTKLNGFFWLPIDKRFDPDGDVEDIATDFNARLDSNVFPGLALLEGAFQLPAGFATLGNSVVSFEYDAYWSEFSFEYGVTDKLTVGVIIPYRFFKNNVDARLDTLNATFGKSATLGSLAPLGFLDTVPLTTEDVIDLVGDGLDIDGDGTIDIPGFGFERFETWDGDGLADIDAGFRYQYFKSENWRLAFTGAVRFPTGELDDPDSLVDIGFGDGTLALLFQLQNDYTAIDNLVLNATFRYDLYLPDKETRRVPDDVNRPITINRERVDRDVGDLFELEASAEYKLLKGLNLSLLYRAGFKTEDAIDGDLGFAYEALEDETDWTSHIFIAGLSYTTIPLYVEKKFPFPFAASLGYRNRFAGSNNALKSQYISFSLGVFF
jgi:hypothetical protein